MTARPMNIGIYIAEKKAIAVQKNMMKKPLEISCAGAGSSGLQIAVNVSNTIAATAYGQILAADM